MINKIFVNLITLMLTILLILLLLSISCTRKIYEPIISTRTIIDTLIIEVPDSTLITALFECDSSNNVIIRELSSVKGRNAQSQISFDSNRLDIQVRWRTKYVDRYVSVHDTITVVELRDVIRERTVIPIFFWYCFGVSVVSIGYGLWRFFR